MSGGTAADPVLSGRRGARRRRIYLSASLLVAVIAVNWFFGLGLLARHLERIADREWETSFGDAGRQVLLARYGETDERGRQLVAIASRLGIELEAKAEPRPTD